MADFKIRGWLAALRGQKEWLAVWLVESGWLSVLIVEGGWLAGLKVEGCYINPSIVHWFSFAEKLLYFSCN